jgi:hypothetical protein
MKSKRHRRKQHQTLTSTGPPAGRSCLHPRPGNHTFLLTFASNLSGIASAQTAPPSRWRAWAACSQPTECARRPQRSETTRGPTVSRLLRTAALHSWRTAWQKGSGPTVTTKGCAWGNKQGPRLASGRLESECECQEARAECLPRVRSS